MTRFALIINMKLTKQILEQFVREHINETFDALGRPLDPVHKTYEPGYLRERDFAPEGSKLQAPHVEEKIPCDCRQPNVTVPHWAKPKSGTTFCPAPKHLYKQGAVGCNPYTGMWEADIDLPRRTKIGPDEPNHKYRGEYGCTDCLEEKDLIKKLLTMRKVFDADPKNNKKVIDNIKDLIYYLTGGMPLGKGLLAAWGYCKGHRRIVSLINRANRRFLKKKGPVKRLIRFAHMKICKLPEVSLVRKNAEAFGRPMCSGKEYRRAYRLARRAGKKRFKFCGKIYSTALKK